MVANGELGEIKRVNWIITTWFRTDGYYVRLFQPHLLHPTSPHPIIPTDPSKLWRVDRTVAAGAALGRARAAAC